MEGSQSLVVVCDELQLSEIESNHVYNACEIV
jgi:hypothetical protein